MAEYTALAPLFTDIANAIRSKTGETGQITANSFPQTIASLQVSKSLSLVDSIDSTFYGTNQTINFTFPQLLDFTSTFYISLSLVSSKTDWGIDDNGTCYWGMGYQGGSATVSHIFFNVFMYGSGSNSINASNFPSLLVPIIPKELKMVSRSNLTDTFEFKGGDFLIYNEILTIPQNRNCFIGLLRSSRALANTVWRLSFYQ